MSSDGYKICLRMSIRTRGRTGAASKGSHTLSSRTKGTEVKSQDRPIEFSCAAQARV